MGKITGIIMMLLTLAAAPGQAAGSAGSQEGMVSWQERYQDALAALIVRYPVPRFPLELAERALASGQERTSPDDAAARTLEYALRFRAALLTGLSAQDAQAAALRRLAIEEQKGPDVGTRLERIDILWRRQQEKAGELGRNGPEHQNTGNRLSNGWRNSGNGGGH